MISEGRSSTGIHDLRRFDNFITEEPAQVGRSPHVSFAPENLGELPLHSGQADQPDNRARVELDQDINITVRTKILPQH